jgi:DNA topoisomerase-6 subunit B
MDMEKETIERVSDVVPIIPVATDPHPHTMKLGDFIAHARLFPRLKLGKWLSTGFSRISVNVAANAIKTAKLKKSTIEQTVQSTKNDDLKSLYEAIQDADLMAPSTKSVMSVGEEGLALSIRRIGEIDFFSVVSRKPIICDYKPIQVEIAVARLSGKTESDEPVQVLRFANRVPLQFDKASCAIVKAITTVNWKSYGLRQPKGSLPTGPYILAVSVVSPFIKFKNASKETIDASEDLVEEIRRALMGSGQRLSRHLKREHRADQLEEKTKHIEQFGPILVETLCRILEAPGKRKVAATEGLRKILGRDTKDAEKKLSTADKRLQEHLEKSNSRLGKMAGLDKISDYKEPDQEDNEEAGEEEEVFKLEATLPGKKTKKKAAKKAPAKKTAKKAAKKAPAKKAAKKVAKKVAKKAPAKKKKATKKKAVKKAPTKKKATKKAAKTTTKKKAKKK